MKQVLIYTKADCPYCAKAKILLDMKGVKYQEINIESNDNMKDEMIRKSGGRMTVPQIFIGDYHVGGFDDLYELHRQGKLDEILSF